MNWYVTSHLSIDSAGVGPNVARHKPSCDGVARRRSDSAASSLLTLVRTETQMALRRFSLTVPGAHRHPHPVRGGRGQRDRAQAGVEDLGLPRREQGPARRDPGLRLRPGLGRHYRRDARGHGERFVQSQPVRVHGDAVEVLWRRLVLRRRHPVRPPGPSDAEQGVQAARIQARTGAPNAGVTGAR